MQIGGHGAVNIRIGDGARQFLMQQSGRGSSTTTCVGGEMVINGKRVVNHGGGSMTVVTNANGVRRARV